MALHIRKGGDSGRGGLVADRRLYRRSDGTPCERGDRRAAFLLAGEGKKVPPEYVERFDMRLEDGRVVWGPRKSEPPPPDPKPDPTPEPKPEVEAEPKPEPQRPEEPVEDPEAPEPVNDGAEKDEDAPEWHLTTDPDEYLDKWPDGPNADLARRVLSWDGG